MSNCRLLADYFFKIYPAPLSNCVQQETPLQAHKWSSCPKGAKRACTNTLEVQKPYYVMQITRLVVLLGGAKPRNTVTMGAMPLCPLQVRACSSAQAVLPAL